MYEKIKHYLKSIFGADTIEQETVINAEYKIIMKLVTESKTLAALFNSRAKIIEFNEKVKAIGSPSWAKNKVKFLEARWSTRYRIWKSRG